MYVSVTLLGRNDPADAAAGFCDITTTSRDKVDMGVEDCLTGVTAAVEAEIEAGY